MAQPDNDISIIATNTLSTDGYVNKVSPVSTVENYGFGVQSLSYQNLNYLWENHGTWIQYLYENQEVDSTALEEEIATRESEVLALQTGLSEEAVTREDKDSSLESEIEALTSRLETLKPTLVTSSVYTSNGDEPSTVVANVSLPENITIGTRYTLANPFGDNIRFRAEAEIFVNGIWTPVEAGETENNNGIGFIAGYVRDEGLVLQTADTRLTKASNKTPNLSDDSTGDILTSAPCRIWCYRDLT